MADETPVTQADFQTFVAGISNSVANFFQATQESLFAAQSAVIQAQADKAKAESETSAVSLKAALDNQSLQTQAALSTFAANQAAASSANSPAPAAGPQVVQTSNTTDFSSFKTPALLLAVGVVAFLFIKKK